MKTVTIRRCNVGNAILNLTEKVRGELGREQDFKLKVVDGDVGEFQVLVGGRMVSRKGDDDVLLAVRSAAGLAV